MKKSAKELSGVDDILLRHLIEAFEPNKMLWFYSLGLGENL